MEPCQHPHLCAELRNATKITKTTNEDEGRRKYLFLIILAKNHFGSISHQIICSDSGLFPELALLKDNAGELFVKR